MNDLEYPVDLHLILAVSVFPSALPQHHVDSPILNFVEQMVSAGWKARG
jgi:hypothetical protein